MKPKASYIDALDPSIFSFIDYEGYEDRYPTLSVQEFPASFYEELRFASRELFQIFAKAATVFQKAPADFAREMDMPENIIPYLHTPNPLCSPTWLSRFDFVLDAAGNLRMVELNADTPCFVIESYYANSVAADFVHRGDPNAGAMDQLRTFLAKMHRTLSRPVVNLSAQDFLRRPFVFSCFHDYVEDCATTQFLMHVMQEACPYADIRFLSFYDMELDKDGIVLEDGAHASALYRLHPLEILIDEMTPEGEPLGEIFLDLYRAGKFFLFNPPEAIILQNKSFMSLVWALYFAKQCFSAHEREILARYLAPSYFESDFDALDDGDYIQKEIWGREGRNVCVLQKRGNHAEMTEEKLVEGYEDIVCRESKHRMYQDFIQQKRFTHNVDSGMKEGYLTLSCFMLLGTPSAVGCRFSPEAIAGTEAYFLPLVLS
ncbi:MAG: glutathionylspermidine synthase family protein [Mitsuokella sp.]